MNDKQITVFIANKRRSNFSIINHSFNLYSTVHLKPNQFFKFRKSIKVANYLTLNVDMIKVLVLAKSQKPGFSPNVIICEKYESRNDDFYCATTLFLSRLTVVLFLK